MKPTYSNQALGEYIRRQGPAAKKPAIAG